MQVSGVTVEADPILPGVPFDLALEPLVSSEGGEIGFKYVLDYTWSRTQYSSCDQRDGPEGARQLRFGLTGDGEISVNGDNNEEGDDNGFLNAGSLGGALSYLWFHIVSRQVTSEPRLDSYPYGVQLIPEFQFTDELDVVDLTLNANAVAAVPYSNDLTRLLWEWLRPNSEDRTLLAAPVLVSAGYALAGRLRNDDDDDDDRLESRVNAEINYQVPVSDRVTLGAEYDLFYVLDDGDFEDLVEVRAQFFVDDARETSFVVSYVDGGIPPEFGAAQAVRLSFSVQW